MAKIKCFMLFCVLIFLCTACKNPIGSRKEVRDTIYTTVVGLDKATEIKGGIKLTYTALPNSAKSGKGDSSGNKSEIFVVEGKTIFDVSRNHRVTLGQKLFGGHIRYILIGEAAAREGITRYIDHFVRDHEIRFNIMVFIVHGNTAEDFIKRVDSDNASVVNQLKNLSDNAYAQSISGKIDLAEISALLDSKSSAPAIPSVTLNFISPKSTHINAPPAVKLEGYGVLKDAKLVDFITDKQARGFNWIKEKVGSAIIVTEDEKLGNIGLEVMKTKTKIKSQVEDDEVSVTIKLDISSNIGDLSKPIDVFNENTLSYLEDWQSQIIKAEVLSAISFAKENNTDIFGIGDKIYHQHPLKWNKIKKEWNSIFPKLDITVEVQSKIRRVYDMREAPGTKGG
jgi:spore germination protein KC